MAEPEERNRAGPPEGEPAGEEALHLETEMFRVMETRRLHLWYQPVVDPGTLRITGFEALRSSSSRSGRGRHAPRLDRSESVGPRP